MSTSAQARSTLPAPSGPAARPPSGDSTGKQPIVSETWKNATGYAGAAGLTLLVLTLTLQLWRLNLTVPLVNAGDGLMGQMFIQNVLESGWFLDNDRLGAPYTQDLRDYPMADFLHFGVIKVLACFSHDAAVIFNVFILLPFPLTALSAYFVCRRLKLSLLAALTVSVLYACAPYHFMRIGGHLFLAAYYLAPLMIWVILRLYMGRTLFLRTDPADGKPRWRLWSWEAAGVVAICVLTGLAGVYYAFFSCFLLLMTGIRVALRVRHWAPLATALLLILAIAAAVGAALSPSFIHSLRYGKNTQVADRLPCEADIYGLHISEMLLPVVGHRLAYLDGLRDRFLAPPRPFTGEAWSTALGLVASLGFLWLLGRFLWRRGHAVERIDDGLAYLNFSSVMLGAIGGIGACFSFYISPMIRCYNRISIFIAFFALCGLFLALQRWADRRSRAAWVRAGLGAFCIAVLVLGALDQTSPAFIPMYTVTKQGYAGDAEFGQRMEAALQPGAMVYELPHFHFPESGPIVNLGDYELLRPFLHTRTLRWSYGGVAGRNAGLWSMYLAARPLPEAVEQLAYAGFQGIYLDRAGFADSGASMEAKLARQLGGAPMVSPNGRQVFFDMTGYVKTLRGSLTDDEWKARHEDALHPVADRWGLASDPEQTPDGDSMRWCGRDALLYIVNLADRPRRVVLKMEYSGWQDAPSRLALDGDLCKRELSLTRERQPLELAVVVPPGEHLLSFTGFGPALAAPNDGHEKVFQLWNFEQHVED